MWNKETLRGLECWSIGSPQSIIKSANTKEEFLDKVNTLGGICDRYGDVSSDLFLYSEYPPDKENFLNAGVYREVYFDCNHYYTPIKLNNEQEILSLSNNVELIKDFEVFKKSKKVYKKLKLKHKRGVLVYGPPGTGKTSTINKVVSQLDLDNALVLFCQNLPPSSVLQNLKNDSRLKVIIFEEFTNALRQDMECTGAMLDFLDGETSLSNCFVIATTNYPESLPKNAVDRPGRFDKFYRIGTPTEHDILVYLEHFNLVGIEDQILKKLLGKTIAEIKEIVLIHFRDGVSFEEAVKQIEHQKDTVYHSFKEDSQKLGFV